MRRILLTFVNDSTFENMSVVCRLEDSHDAIIRPVAELPNVRELRQDQGLGRLHESGWMENALFFTEDYHDPAVVESLWQKKRPAGLMRFGKNVPMISIASPGVSKTRYKIPERGLI